MIFLLIILSIVIIAAAITIFIKNDPQFGGKATEQEVNRLESSSNWKEGKFQNIEETSMDIKISKIPTLFKKQFRSRKIGMPEQNIPILPIDKVRFLNNDEAQFIWYGHSVLLMRLAGKTILIDPMLGPDASPIAPLTTKRFSESSLAIIDDLPEIDLLLMTHDHYDHLDYASIKRLIPKVKEYYVALGCARHFVHWGISPSNIKEFDWWDQQTFNDIEITFTPSRHFSGRGLADRAKCLWGGWIFQTENNKIYWSGDGGYGSHFKEIGDKFGPFDIGFMECGQYNEEWQQIHMFPEESPQAAIDAGVKVAIPVHWGGFKLAMHAWKEPAEIFVKTATEKGLDVCTPQIGAQFSLKEYPKERWYDSME